MPKYNGGFRIASKPFPPKSGFEARFPEWIDRTRRRRYEVELAQRAETISRDLLIAGLEREVERVASENARGALQETSNLLTTVNAHLHTVTSLAGKGAHSDPKLGQIQRNIEEARRTAEAAMTVSANYFDSSYGLRDTSPAVVSEGINDAIAIINRTCRAEESNKTFSFGSFDSRISIRGLTGMQFLLTMVASVGVAATVAPPSSTVGVSCENVSRLDAAVRDPKHLGFLWINRRSALNGQPGVVVTITASGTSPGRSELEAWLKGNYAPLEQFPARSLLAGIQQGQGLVGFSMPPQATHFRIVLVLPV